MTTPQYRRRHGREILRPGVVGLAVIALISACLVQVAITRSADAAGGYNASEVIGQYDLSGNQSFTEDHLYGQIGMRETAGIAYDAVSNTVFVADKFNHRVLAYAKDPTTHVAALEPYAVLGQPSLTETTAGVTSQKMSEPQGAVVDESRRLLFVTDQGNNRVLVFDIATLTSGEAAVNVIGQANFTTSTAGNGQAGMSEPFQPSFDPATNYLYVAHEALHRITVYNTTTITNGMNASFVLAQPNFTTYTSGVSSQKVAEPGGLTVDSERGYLWVTDWTNDRVLAFNIGDGVTTNEAAVKVLGQPNFTSGSSAVSQTGMTGPEDVTVDPTRDRLYVATGSNLLKVYDIATVVDNEAAIYVVGQPNHTSNAVNTTQQGLNQPWGVAYEPEGDRIYVGDRYNDRVMVFNASITSDNPAAINALGHQGDDGLVDYGSSNADGAITSWGFDNARAIELDAVNHRLFIADRLVSRVLVHQLDDNNRLIDRRAEWVLGQPNFSTDGFSVTQSTMDEPVSLAYDPTANHLYVADDFNSRVLVFDVASITNGENAAYVLGQPNFTTNSIGVTQAKMNRASGVELDVSGRRLFVADEDSSRILVYNISTLSNGMNATNVLGQTNFTSSGSGLTANTVNQASASMAFDSSNSRLYAVDENNSRVLVYDVAAITDGEAAVNVLGQTNFTTSTPGLSQSKIADNADSATIDVAGQRLFVSDKDNNRVLQFDVASITNGENAVRVFGQTNFTSNSAGVDQDYLRGPRDVLYDPSNRRLWVADELNHRFVTFEVDTNITTTLPATMAKDSPVSTQFAATNPNGTTTYSVTSGSLPTGLSLSSGGLLSGTPSAYGNYNFTVTASTSPSGHGTLTGSKAYSVSIPVPPYNASTVLGQYDGTGAESYTNRYPQGQGGFNQPAGMAIDSTSSTLFVADRNAHRVLAFHIDPTTHVAESQPYAILGQQDFVSTAAGTTQSTLSSPVGVAVDEAGRRLFVSEIGNQRVSVFDIATLSTGEAAVNVLGKPHFTTTSGDTTSTGLAGPYQAAYDPTTKYLYVPDNNNGRVMVFDTNSVTNGEAAVKVLGQPNFTTYTQGRSQSVMWDPSHAAIDSSRQLLYVADWANKRVMVFDVASITDGENAVNVLGQADFTANVSAVSQSGMSGPEGLMLDTSRNRLYVTDTASHRVTAYDVATITNGENAVAVLGQSSYTAGTSDTNSEGFYSPFGGAYHSAGDRLYVADNDNNRVLVFDGAFGSNNASAVNELGHRSSAGTPNYTSATAFGRDPTSWGLNQTTGLALDATGHRLFVADKDNHRVLVHTLDSSNRLTDRTADFVLGQSNFTSNTNGTTQSTLEGPYAVAFHESTNRLFVGDTGNHRVMVFDVASITNGENAINVLGQADFVSGAGATSQNRLSANYGIGLDPSNQRLFVGDTGNNRVMVFDVAAITNGENAVNVLGQANFTNTTSGTTSATLNSPSSSAWDSSTNRLFVNDENNARVLVYDIAAITNGEAAINVLGQTNFTTSTPGLSSSKFASGFEGIDLDITKRKLFVNDTNNHRTLVFDVATVTDGEAAERVIGQSNFTSGSASTVREGLRSPLGLVYDPTQETLFLGDHQNHRVVVYDVQTRITTSSLPDATNGASYSQQLSATNPNGVTTYSLTSGSLPPGLSLSSAGAITGTPSGASGVYNFTITASTSPEGHGTLTGSRALSITMTNNAPNAPTNLAQTKTDTTPLPSTTHHTFDANSESWTESGGAAVARDTAIKRSGAASLRVDTVAATAFARNAMTVATDRSAQGSTFSAWVYLPSTNTGSNWRAGMRIQDSSNTYFSVPTDPLTPDSWTLITITPPASVLADMKRVAVAISASGPTGTNPIYIDDVQQGSGIWTNETSVRFTGSVSDQDSADTNQLCIEAQPIGTAFTNTEQSCGSGVAYAGSPVAAIHTLGSLTNGTQYHWQARTRDAGGLYSSWVAYGANKDTVTASPDFGIDTTAPTTGTARDGATQGVDSALNDGSLNSLGGNWTGFGESGSGIARYEYSIGTSAGGTQISGWSSTSNTEATRSGLSLRTGQLYYFNVRAVDVAGNTGSVVSSNGQMVAPTLQFSVSSQTITFDPAHSGNGYAPATKSINVTTSTNAYSGYVVRQYNQSLMTSGANTIPAYSGTYSAPTAWTGNGFGYTTNDTAIQAAGNPFQGATRYAGLTTAPPGDIVADHTSTVTGTPISNQTFILSYKIVGTMTTPAGTYSTTIRLGATALY